MSLRPRPDLPVPDDTAHVARAIFPEGNLVMRMRDELLDGNRALFRDDDFADLFPEVGQPAAAPARLALVLVLQFMEALTDRQAADAVRTRIVVDQGSTGSTSSVCLSPTAASITPC